MEPKTLFETVAEITACYYNCENKQHKLKKSNKGVSFQGIGRVPRKPKTPKVR